MNIARKCLALIGSGASMLLIPLSSLPPLSISPLDTSIAVSMVIVFLLLNGRGILQKIELGQVSLPEIVQQARSYWVVHSASTYGRTMQPWGGIFININIEIKGFLISPIYIMFLDWLVFFSPSSGTWFVYDNIKCMQTDTRYNSHLEIYVLV